MVTTDTGLPAANSGGERGITPGTGDWHLCRGGRQT